MHWCQGPEPAKSGKVYCDQPATILKTWPLVNEFCWNWVQLTQPLKSIGFGIKVQSVFWSSRRRRLPRTEQEMIWTNQKLPLMIHVLWPGFPFSFSLCSGPMRKDCCFDSAVQEVLCITWEVSAREIAWVVPKPLISGYVFVIWDTFTSFLSLLIK